MIKEMIQASSVEKKTWKGSFTVEAAAVISITFLVLGSLILAVFFVHDRAVMQSMICEAAAAGSNFMTQKENAEQAEKVIDQIAGSRFMGSRSISAEKGISEKTASASGGASYAVPGMFMKFLKGGKLEIQCSWSSSILQPADTIRKIRGAELVLEGFME